MLGNRTGAQFPTMDVTGVLKSGTNKSYIREMKLGEDIDKTLSSQIPLLTWHDRNYLDFTHQGTTKNTKLYITLFKLLNPQRLMDKNDSLLHIKIY